MLTQLLKCACIRAIWLINAVVVVYILYSINLYMVCICLYLDIYASKVHFAAMIGILAAHCAIGTQAVKLMFWRTQIVKAALKNLDTFFSTVQLTIENSI